jgi:transposase InsO family protein
MRIGHVLRNTKGFAKAAKSALKWRSMRNKAAVERRVKILTFWKQHGLEATKDAFGVGRATLFRWQQILDQHQGNISSLDPQSTAPQKKRVRTIPPALEEALIAWRTTHPRIGGKKLVSLLEKQGFVVSRIYIDRCISDLKQLDRVPKVTKLSFYARSGRHHEKAQTKVKKHRRPQKQGLEVDTIIRHIDGTKRYILTAIDVAGRFAYAYTYTNHSSASARDFLNRLIERAPFTITEIQTDNGSEFAHHFHEACLALGITHYHTYPRSPKMNAFIERFNRTLSEECLVYNRTLMRDDVKEFNATLTKWLHWYNHDRPHEGLGLLAPMEYYKSLLVGVS